MTKGYNSISRTIIKLLVHDSANYMEQQVFLESTDVLT